MPLVSVRNLKRHYDIRLPGGLFGSRAKLKAVDGIGFDLKKGETLGLVGESGCGKSTTAKLVLGLIPATSGTVSFDGSAVTAVHDAKWRRMRRRMQMIYQDPLGALDRRLPVSSQIGESIAVHEPDVPAKERDARVGEIMASVGLRADQAASYPHELSGGQRQRVVIARALALKPDFIVCDEPVSALDVSIQAQVLNLLEDIKERNNFTSLFISHDLKVVRQMSDRVAVMYLGMIVEEGPPEDVFHAPMHPYTRALVSAIPTPSRRGKRERIVLEGDPPNPVNKPYGCPFHPRCPSAISECREFQPVLESHGPRKVACHLHAAPSAAVAAAE